MHLYLPGGIIHFTRPPAVFNRKAGRRSHRERRHMIIGMAAQIHDDRDLLVVTQIIGCAHIIQ